LKWSRKRGARSLDKTRRDDRNGNEPTHIPFSAQLKKPTMSPMVLELTREDLRRIRGDDDDEKAVSSFLRL
jgi:hypothetical protein